ncbi:NF-kappa-B inhibitor cactus-like [Pollicipes pollicipes]|uniref:NF-kappa-B inhibitor cactus-like n=1 Tax=Pollicipes pollicipes TaxID=41117 RepID=UPI001884F3AF|nr:NF-kappa-B inhibitor cactus-like [Pollicipes pollicipes]
MSHNGVNGGWNGEGTTVSDCAAALPTRGAAPHRLRLGKQRDLAPLDSGFVSGLLSPADGLSPAPGAPPLRYPKEASQRPGEGADERLSAGLSGLQLDECELSGAERGVWERRYLQVLDEAFRGDEDGDTHLHLAIIYEYAGVAECLVRLVPHPDFLNLRNSYMQTPLHLAALTGQAALCRHLVVAGADTNHRDRHGNTPLHLACERADRRCVQALTAPVSACETRLAAPRYALPPAAPPPPLDEWNYQGE